LGSKYKQGNSRDTTTCNVLVLLFGIYAKGQQGHMRRELSGMGVMPIAHNKDKDNGNGRGGGGGNHIEDSNDGDDAVGKGELLSSY
jgi:hypothetical protein